MNEDLSCPLQLDAAQIIEILKENAEIQKGNLEIQKQMMALLSEDRKENQEKERTKRNVLITALVMSGLIICTMVWSYFSAAYNNNFAVDMKIDNKAQSEVQQEYRR